MKSRKHKSKDTFYNGYKFRSRLEAKWAYWSDCIGKKYIYEMEGFELGNGISYLPDFWFPEDNFWVEIKPETPTLEEIEKAIRLEEYTGFPVIFFVGQPWPTECTSRYYQRKIGNGLYKESFHDAWWSDSTQDYKILRAFQKVRKARFEFGETPSGQMCLPFTKTA
jgi:hypothetical protein